MDRLRNAETSSKVLCHITFRTPSVGTPVYVCVCVCVCVCVKDIHYMITTQVHIHAQPPCRKASLTSAVGGRYIVSILTPAGSLSIPLSPALMGSMLPCVYVQTVMVTEIFMPQKMHTHTHTHTHTRTHTYTHTHTQPSLKCE